MLGNTISTELARIKELSPPASSAPNAVREYVREVVKKYREIGRAFCSTDIAYTTISVLSAFFGRPRESENTIVMDAERAAKLERIRAMLERYSAGMKRDLSLTVENRHADGYANKHANGHTDGHARWGVAETVIVTGTTGDFGSRLFARGTRGCRACSRPRPQVFETCGEIGQALEGCIRAAERLC